MNTEMNNEMNVKCGDMSVTTLLLKTLENATREYARVCVMKCASAYGFDINEALRSLNLEKLTIQVREMKKRGTEKTKKEAKVKEVKTVKAEKAVKVKAEKAYKASIPLPFVDSMVSSEGCQGLAFNGGLFTQCQKMRMSESSYCKGCQSEADLSASGTPLNGNVEQRLGCFMMDFRDSKGRAPIAYSKIMEKQQLTREQVETEAGKLNIVIDDIHFAIVEKKIDAGRPKAAKKTVTVVESNATVEDLFAQLVDDDSEDDTATVLQCDSEDEVEVDTKGQEKAERDMMKEADCESKKVEKTIKNAEKERDRIEALRSAKEQKMAADLAAKEQKMAADLAAKEQKMAADLAAKEQKMAADLAAKAAKEQKMADEKAAKEQKMADDKLAKEQKKIDDQIAKEAKIAADLLAKEEKIAADLAAKALVQQQKEQKMADDKLAKEQKMADDKLAKEQKIATDLLAKEQKIAADLAAKALVQQQKEQKLIDDKLAKEKKMADEKAAKESKAQQSKAQPAKAEPKVAAAAAAEPVSSKKITVKRITIGGKQYLKTADNLLYDPDTKEEMGIYDPVTNTMKELPDDSEDEVEEDGYTSE
jgi:hypothetical protein